MYRLRLTICTVIRLPRPRMPYSGRVDLCVVASTPNEFKAARKVLEHVTNSTFEGPIDCFKIGTRQLMVILYYIEWNEFNEGEESPLRIGLVIPIEMGREAAAQLVNNISHTTLNPSMIVMVGIAAGNDKEVELGDVLVPFFFRDARKEFEGSKRSVDAQMVSLEEIMKTIVRPVGVIGECPWMSLIPDDMKDTPSPIYLQDFILSKVQCYILMRYSTFSLSLSALIDSFRRGKTGEDLQRD